MNDIQTNQDMREYIMIELGYPAINVELHPKQLDHYISKTAKRFRKYNYGDGSYLNTTTIGIKNGVSEYKLTDLDDDIEAVFNFDMSLSWGGINTLFSPTHVLLYDSWVTQGNYPGGPGGGSNQGGAMTTFEIYGEYMAGLDQMLGKQYVMSYVKAKNALVVTPTPTQDMVATLELYTHAGIESLYNMDVFQDLAIAYCKKAWGENIGKFDGKMPDGSMINWQRIYDDGKEMIEKFEENMKMESEPPLFFVG